jgi:hypothetical protein
MCFIFSKLGVLITVIENDSGGNENSQIVILMTSPLLSDPFVRGGTRFGRFDFWLFTLLGTLEEHRRIKHVYFRVQSFYFNFSLFTLLKALRQGLW